MNEVFHPDAFKKFEGLRVPVKFQDQVVGVADISRDGEIINAELFSGQVPRELRRVFLDRTANHLNISIGYKAAQPISDKEK